MINTTSYELSEELNQLTGWDDTPFVWALPTEINKNGMAYLKTRDGGNRYWRERAAYDLAYLLRKLPPEVNFDGHWESFTLDVYGGRWSLRYGLRAPTPLEAKANNPEDAACKLLITLKQMELI